MTPIVKLLRLCDGEEPAMGKIYHRMFDVIEKTKKSDVTWAPTALEKIETRWEYLHSFMHGAGYALDPEFMQNTQDWDLATSNGVMEVIERLCIRDICAAADDPEEARKKITASDTEVIERVAKCELELSKYRENEGVFTRGSVISNAKTMPPANWWAMYGKHLPILSGVAKTVLSQVVCASAAERNWSIYGQIKNEKRHALSHATGDKLVYCHEALHLKDKLQKAGYEAKMVKWDSDSDSDESDDEKELMQ